MMPRVTDVELLEAEARYGRAQYRMIQLAHRIDEQSGIVEQDENPSLQTLIEEVGGARKALRDLYRKAAQDSRPEPPSATNNGLELLLSTTVTKLEKGPWAVPGRWGGAFRLKNLIVRCPKGLRRIEVQIVCDEGFHTSAHILPPGCLSWFCDVSGFSCDRGVQVRISTDIGWGEDDGPLTVEIWGTPVGS